MSDTSNNGLETIADITAVRGHIQAVAFAKRGGAALSALLGDIATTKSVERRGPIQMFLFLETHFTDAEGHAIPVVGSKQSEVGQNEPFDRYTAEVKTPDGTRKVPGSVYTDIVKATGEGQRILHRIELCGAGQGVELPADILKMGTAQRKVEIKELRQRLADMRGGLTKGAMLFHQVEAIGKMNPDRVKVKMPFFTEKDDNGEENTVVKGSTIRIQDPKGELEDEILNVGQVLQYDVAKAKAMDGGTLTSLKATASRAPKKKPIAGTSTAPTVPSNLEQGKTLFNVLSTWVDNTTPEGQRVESMLLAAMAKKNAEGKELLMSVGRLCLALDSIWTVIQKDYDQINRDAMMATQKAG